MDVILDCIPTKSRINPIFIKQDQLAYYLQLPIAHVLLPRAIGKTVILLLILLSY